MEIKEAAWYFKLLSLQRWGKHISSAWDQQGDGHFPSGRRTCFKGLWSSRKVSDFHKHGAIAWMATELVSIDFHQLGREYQLLLVKGK